MNWDYIKKARILLSESTDFQAWVSVANANDALDKIYYFRQDVPSDAKFAVITPNSEMYERVATGTGIGAFTNEFTCSITFLERFASSDTDWSITSSDSFFDNIQLFKDYFLSNSQKTSPTPLIVIDTMEEDTDGEFTMTFQAEQDSGDVDPKGYFNTWIIGRKR